MDAIKKIKSTIPVIRDSIRRSIGRLLYDRKPKIKKITADKINNILIVRWDAKYGDTFVSSFIFRELKKLRHTVKIKIITTSLMASIYKNQYGVESLFICRKKPKYSELTSLAHSIGHVDAIVHLKEKMKMKEIYFLSLFKDAIKFGIDDKLKMIDFKLGEETSGKHFIDKYKRILEILGCKNINPKYWIPENRKNLSHDIISLEKKNYCVVNPFGDSNARILSGKKIIEIIQKIKIQYDGNIVFIGINKHREKLSRIKERLEEKLPLITPETKSIFDVIELIKHSEFVISVDTSTIHIASGFNKPTLGIYNPDINNFNHWRGRSDMFKYICSHKSDSISVNNINIDEFENKLKALLI